MTEDTLNPHRVLADWQAREPLPADELELARAIADRLWKDGSRLGDVIVEMLYEGEDELGDDFDPDEPMIDEKAVAAIVGLEPKTLGDIRRRGGGPPYFQIPGSKAIRYRPSEVRRWLADHHVPGDLSWTLRRRVQLVKAKAQGIANPELQSTHATMMTAAARDREARERIRGAAMPPPDPALVKATKIVEALRVGATKSEAEKAELLAAAIREGSQP